MTLVDAAESARVEDWSEAVRASAEILVRLQAASPGYPDACVDVVRTHGPYIVITPGLALVHASPASGGTALGIGVLRLGQPVNFGHPSNDPVDLLVAFSSPDHDAHVDMLSALAQALGDGLADRLRAASGPAEIRASVEEVLGGG